MKMVHFTEGAADVLVKFNARAARFVPLADGEGDTHISCLHLASGAIIPSPPTTHDCALLVVYGTAKAVLLSSGAVLYLDPGEGMIVETGEHYSLTSPDGAILIIVESGYLEAAEGSQQAGGEGKPWPGAIVRPPTDQVESSND